MPDLLPCYECNENQFVENLKRILRVRPRLVVNRSVGNYDDGRYGLSFLPEQEFDKYSKIAQRRSQGATAICRVPFIDDFHHTFFARGATLHSGRYHNLVYLSIPYVKLEYTLTIWGESYWHRYDVLYSPELRIEPRSTLPKRRLLAQSGGEEPTVGFNPFLIHVLRFKPPSDNLYSLHLPPSVLVLDVLHQIRP